MRSLSKLKKGMGYENACLATEGRVGVPWALPGTPRVVLDPPLPRGTPGAFLAAASLIFVSAMISVSYEVVVVKMHDQI